MCECHQYFLNLVLTWLRFRKRSTVVFLNELWTDSGNSCADWLEISSKILLGSLECWYFRLLQGLNFYLFGHHSPTTKIQLWNADKPIEISRCISRWWKKCPFLNKYLYKLNTNKLKFKPMRITSVRRWIVLFTPFSSLFRKNLY